MPLWLALIENLVEVFYDNNFYDNKNIKSISGIL